ncbi:MAG: hypothetical protein ACKOX6_17635 [Bdellovibrio sp.]
MILSQTFKQGSSGFIKTMVLVSMLISSAAMAQGTHKPLVDDKYSLKADREAMEALRKNIPAEKKAANDEKAFMDEMLSDLSQSPMEVRGRFTSILSKKRDAFSRDMTKIREEFQKKQTAEREAFSKEQSAEREKFAKTKATPQERNEFYANTDGKRKEFYQVQHEQRDVFEAEAREKRKNFDDYVRAKTDEFNQAHRDYTKRYEENKKNTADLKKQAAEKKKNFEKNIDQEYEPIRQKPVTPLGVGE